MRLARPIINEAAKSHDSAAKPKIADRLQNVRHRRMDEEHATPGISAVT